MLTAELLTAAVRAMPGHERDVLTWQAWPDRVGWLLCRLGDDPSAGAFDAYAIARAIVQAIPDTSFRIVEDRSMGELGGVTLCVGPVTAQTTQMNDT